MEIIVISLLSAVDRRAFQKEQLGSLNLKFRFLNAIPKDLVSLETIRKHYYDWYRPLSKNEIACFQSHDLAWNIVINDDKPYLILEDDALLSKKINSILPTLSKIENYDLINLENRGRKKFLSKSGIEINSETVLYKLFQDRTGAAAYILWPSGARKLIDFTKNNGISLADAHITSCPKLETGQIEPTYAVQLDHCSFYGISNIHIHLGKSSVSKTKNYKGGVYFRLKRISSQIILGIKILYISMISKRRFIRLNPEDF